MKTYTPTAMRQHFFQVLQQAGKNGQVVQITCQKRGKLANNNYYVISQKQFNHLQTIKNLLKKLKKVL